MLAALEWWEDAQHTSGSQRAAAGVRWWQLPKAATSSGSEAATWRTSRTASLSLVSAQPQLMADILRTCSGGGAGAAKRPPPQLSAAAAMDEALRAAGVSWLEVCEWHGAQDWSAERTLLTEELPRNTAQAPAKGKRSPLRQLLRTLTISSLATGTAMHAVAMCANAGSANTGDSEPAGALDEAATLKCVAVTADVLAAVCVRIMHGLRVPLTRSDANGDTTGGLVDGGVMHAMLVVVHHTLLWLTALALAAGSGLAAVSADAGSPQQAARSVGLAAVLPLVRAIQRTCEGLEGSLGECQAALADGSGVCEAVSTRHRRCLAEVASEEAVLAELKSLGKAQRAVLADAAKAVTRMLAACRRVLEHVREGQ